MLTELDGQSLNGAWNTMRAETLEAIGFLPASRLQGRCALTKLRDRSSEGARRTILHSSGMESISDNGK